MQGRAGGGFWTRIHRERGLTANIFFLQSEMNSYVIDGTKVKKNMFLGATQQLGNAGGGSVHDVRTSLILSLLSCYCCGI